MQSVTETTPAAHCEYALLPDGIHCFRVHRATRRCVDEYLARLGTLFAAHPKDETPFCFLVDLRPAGMPPFAYTMQQSRVFIRSKPLPQRIRVVYLHHNDPILHTMAIFLRAMRLFSERLILNGGTEAEAIEWLLSGDSVQRSVRIR